MRALLTLLTTFLCLLSSAFANNNTSMEPGIGNQNPTNITLLAPMQMGRLNPELRVVQKINGSCFAPSIADNSRADAWRCSVGNEIYDPCFGENNKVICLNSPWSKEAIVLMTTKLPVNNNAESNKLLRGAPWGIELANGERCTLLTGATGSFANMRASYACGKDGLTYGDIDKTYNKWRIFYQPDDSITVKQITITTAWY